jgi:hypothetical protein
LTAFGSTGECFETGVCDLELHVCRFFAQIIFRTLPIVTDGHIFSRYIFLEWKTMRNISRLQTLRSRCKNSINGYVARQREHFYVKIQSTINNLTFGYDVDAVRRKDEKWRIGRPLTA